jgi:histidyl-tRNA synthetase
MQSIRGMRDLLPAEVRRWQHIEQTAQRLVDSFGYEEIRLPLIEFTELFARGVGTATDIVDKEMYNLHDRDGEALSLRPEGTAGCVRACIQHGLIFNQMQRLWYRGPMFRYEKPQKGRYRQFDQIGVEAFGMHGPDIDAELLQLGTELFAALAVAPLLRLQLNTLGSVATRHSYRRALVEFLTPHLADLDPDSQRRLTRNPLRILDSKDAATRAILVNAPRIEDHLDADSVTHFDGLRRLLDALGIEYTVNRQLVRGLDYYSGTVFEWTTDAIGAQDTVCAGGRYDGLVEQLGGRATAAAGFALGLDRLVLLHEAAASPFDAGALDGYCAVLDARHMPWAMLLCERLRKAAPGLRVRVHAGGGKLKAQLKRADASGAQWALIVGDDEVRDEAISLKWLRLDVPQERLKVGEVPGRLAQAKQGGH